MTYPVDDAGNPRVDFVWGQFPLQPNDQRERTDESGENITTDGNWTVIKERGSSNLNSGWTTLTFGTGDGGNTREQVFTFDSHDIATTGYSDYPSFLPDYAGDGDPGLEMIVPDIRNLTAAEALVKVSATGIYFNSTGTYIGATVANDGKWKSQDVPAGTLANAGDSLNAVYYAAPVVPNLVGLTEAAATTALTAAHLTKGTVTTANNAAGATAINDGKVKTQSITPATKVDTGTAVALVKYAYTPVAPTTGPIATITNPLLEGLGENEAWMYLLGRTVKPTVGNFITVTGNGGTQYNSNNYEVMSVANDDSFNTGGTKVKIHCVTGTLTPGVLGNGGTWAIAG